MKLKIILPILLFVFPFIISAQSTAKEWYDKGLKLKDAGDCEAALTAFKTAISKKTDYNEAYYQAGWCSNLLENYEDAVDFLKKSNPSTNDAKKNKYNELGFSYYSLQNGKDGIEQYNKTLALYPNDGTAIRGMGKIYYELEEDHEKAIEYYERALKVDEENSRSVYYDLGWLYNDGERYDDAVKVLLKGIQYDSEHSGYREELGYAYYMKVEYEFAITQLNKAISLDEKSQLGYYYKGLCFVATNKKGEAMSMYYKLKELESEHTEELMEKIKTLK